MAAAAGVLIVGRVSEVVSRDREPDKYGNPQKPVVTVYIAGPRAVEETWGEDAGYAEGDLVAVRGVPQLPSEKLRRLTFRRVSVVTPEELLAVAKEMAASRKAA